MLTTKQTLPLVEELFSGGAFEAQLKQWAKVNKMMLSLAYLDKGNLDELRLLHNVNQKISVRLERLIELKEAELQAGEKSLTEIYRSFN